MTPEEIERLKGIEENAKSAHKRIDALERKQNNLQRLTEAFSVLKNEQEHIKSDVSEIKDDVKTLIAKPAKRWDGLVEKVLTVLVGIAVGVLINGGGAF